MVARRSAPDPLAVMNSHRSLLPDLRTLFLVVVYFLLSPSAAQAHGEQLLLLFGPWFLFLVAGLISLVVWKVPWRLKLSLFGVLVLSIASMFFLPVLPQKMSELALASPVRLVMVAAGLPIAACVVAYFGLRRVFARRP